MKKILINPQIFAHLETANIIRENGWKQRNYDVTINKKLFSPISFGEILKEDKVNLVMPSKRKIKSRNQRRQNVAGKCGLYSKFNIRILH